jgi:serine/threonine-protein kinase RsbW
MSQADMAARDCGTSSTSRLPSLNPGPVPPVLWWARDFPGDTEQVPEARHWLEDLLPECDPLADILLLASELCTNAIAHTRSGQGGGRFSVDVEWTPALARVVIGDQGSPSVPAIGAGTSDTTDEFGRGLWLVDQLADGWGTGCHPAGRVVWVDLRWQARGGPPLESAVTAAMRRAFPRTTIWWGHQTQAWWAVLPEATGASGLISSPTAGGLGKVLADACPQFSQGGEGALLSPGPAAVDPALLGLSQPENA